MKILQELENRKVSTDLIDRLAFSRDASIYRLVPEAVIRPENESDIRIILKNANRNMVPVTFRTGGTSLSGQAITNGYMVEVLNGWKKFEIQNNGRSIKIQPGLTGAYINGILKNYGRKIGPDPASIKAARIGGIVSNNASGMACGVSGNSYHTLKAIRFILPNGNTYDTSHQEDYNNFSAKDSDLALGITKIRREILDSPALIEKIRHKYRIKNTIGYSMNSFLDYDHPLDIFAHLLVGSEGTLAFISDITLDTLDDPSEKSTGLFLFPDPGSATTCIPGLRSFDPASIELMDKASLDTARYIKDFPLDFKDHSSDSIALLVEFQSNSIDANIKNTSEASRLISSMKGESVMNWQTDEFLRSQMWALRKGLYPTVGSMRKKGTSVITEDLCYDISSLGDAINELRNIFQRRNTQDGVIFGHAQDGNLHFVASVDLNDPDAAKEYDSLMNDLVDMTISKFDGSLKGEHGTGRNMAPFVELEWGSELYALMQEIKLYADPKNILNPGVILHGGDKKIHVKNLKTLPVIDDSIDLCIECGFCEPVCPSKEFTLTPRQRIIVQRELSDLAVTSTDDYNKVLSDFHYKGMDTCAVDGMCETACPVNINTGDLVALLRHKSNNKIKSQFAQLILDNFKIATSGIRVLLAYFNFIKKYPVFYRVLLKIFSWGHSILPGSIPKINSKIPGPAKKTDFNSFKKRSGAIDYIYFPSCLTRTMGTGVNNENLAEIIMNIAEIKKLNVHILEKSDSLCCGTPFHSKGYFEQNTIALERSVHQIYKQTEQGRIPVLIDTSPCTNQFKHGNKYLKGDSLIKWESIKWVDIAEYLWESVKNSDLPPIDKKVAAHPTCSTDKMEHRQLFLDTAEKCATKVEIAPEWGCCGFAGDRGFWVPELTRNATKGEKEYFAESDNYDCGVSTSRTCEIGMENATNIPFESLANIVLKYLNQSKN